MTSTPFAPAHHEQLTALGSELRVALDGPFAAERAVARATWPAEGMHRDPSLSLEESRQWVFERLKHLNEHGFGSTGLPTAPGETSDPIGAVTTFEILAHGDLSVTVKSGVQFGLFGGAVTNLGTEWHHKTFLPKIASLELLGGFAMTELGHGSDVSSLETTITYLPETQEFEVHSPSLSASKAYIGNAARDGHMAAVFGQLIVGGESKGVHVILVPIRENGRPAPGVTIGDHGHKGGLLGIDNGTIRFDHVRVPRTMLLDRYGGVDENGQYVSPIENPGRRFFTMLGTLVRGRVCISAAGGIATRRALSIATRYALERRQFEAPGHPDGVTLLDYQVHQRRLFPLIARTYAHGFAQNTLLSALAHVQGGDEYTEREQRELESLAAGLKAMSTSFANMAIQEAREACGGAGYMSENMLTEIRRDVDIFATFEGDNTVLLQLVAKGLLTDVRDTWAALDRSGVFQASMRVAGNYVAERTNARIAFESLVQAARRRPEETTLVDRGWHLYMFEERARHSLESLARRMQRAAKAKTFDAFNAVGDHIQFTAKAHMERVILDAFVEGIAEVEDRDAKEVLERLCSLYALSSIHADRGWFQEHNRISGGRAKALGAQITALCAELRPHAIPIVEGMGIPESWLGTRMLDAEWNS